jgi:hypothetical protein
MRGAILAAVVALAGGAAAQTSTFDYAPTPRWTEDPETEVVCAAVRAECPAQLKDGEVEAEWGYDEYYDSDGMLVGIHSLKSTGCTPLDEHLLLSHRHFRTTFSQAGKPDLDDIRIELAPGTSKTGVRLVKRGSTQVSFGC